MPQQRIGWIGTGVMGAPMCGHLLAAGHEVHVYSRTPAKAQALLEKGARWCASPAAVAAGSDVVFTMVGFPAEVEAVLLGGDGVLAAAHPHSVIIDMSTSPPALARRLAAAAAGRGVNALDAPVSGGDVGARDATLAIMVGGEEATFRQVEPLLQLLGKRVTHMGPAGAGQHTKMCNQILIASTMIGVVEALLYAARSGLDPSRVIDVIGSGAAASWAINNLGPRIVARDYQPGFYIKHFIKDLGIALEEARRMGLSLPGLELARQLYDQARDLDLENCGTQALYKVLSLSPHPP
jgi:3-hydroxyisobutyrate dehydrogenase